jgi:GTP-binding protein
MLVDEVTITVKAGNGGNGARTFLHLPNSFKTPADGGNGGHGGSVYVVGSHNISDLSEFRYTKEIEAENGENGGVHNMYGKQGADTTILLPFGTHVTNTETGETFEIITSEPIEIAQGGKGGLGNKALFNKPPRKGVVYSTEGKPGEQKELHLELKYIADVGLVGYPNAGKSSLLAALTNADPKVGDYAFTTVEPNLGVHEGVVIADIPGLIEGASSGKGLGIKFLKHIEKTNLLLHLIDATSANTIEQYEAIQQEFEHYKNGFLLQKPEIILLSKSDLVDPQDMEAKIDIFKRKGFNVMPFSIYNEEQIRELRKKLHQAIHE